MKKSSICLALASILLAGPAMSAQEGAAAKGRTVTITGNDTMKYDVTTIAAKPGETLHIVLKNAGSMPKIAMAHNVVVLKPGTDGAAFTSAGMTSRETDFIAPAQKASVLAATKLAGAGETVEVMRVTEHATPDRQAVGLRISRRNEKRCERGAERSRLLDVRDVGGRQTDDA